MVYGVHVTADFNGHMKASLIRTMKVYRHSFAQTKLKKVKKSQKGVYIRHDLFNAKKKAADSLVPSNLVQARDETNKRHH